MRTGDLIPRGMRRGFTKGDANLFCHVWLTSPLSLYRQSLEGHTSLERARVIKPHSCHSQPWRPAHGHEGLLSRPSTDSYSHTTLISRPIALNSGSPVYTSTFSRVASAAAKQSATAGLNVTVFALRSRRNEVTVIAWKE